MASPETIHTSKILQTEQVIFKNMCVYTYVYVTKQLKKKHGSIIGKIAKRRIWEGLEGRRGRGRRCNYNLKKQKNFKNVSCGALGMCRRPIQVG